MLGHSCWAALLHGRWYLIPAPPCWARGLSSGLPTLNSLTGGPVLLADPPIHGALAPVVPKPPAPRCCEGDRLTPCSWRQRVAGTAQRSLPPPSLSTQRGPLPEPCTCRCVVKGRNRDGAAGMQDRSQASASIEDRLSVTAGELAPAQVELGPVLRCRGLAPGCALCAPRRRASRGRGRCWRDWLARWVRPLWGLPCCGFRLDCV